MMKVQRPILTDEMADRLLTADDTVKRLLSANRRLVLERDNLMAQVEQLQAVNNTLKSIARAANRFVNQKVDDGMLPGIYGQRFRELVTRLQVWDISEPP